MTCRVISGLVVPVRLSRYFLFVVKALLFRKPRSLLPRLFCCLFPLRQILFYQLR